MDLNKNKLIWPYDYHAKKKKKYVAVALLQSIVRLYECVCIYIYVENNIYTKHMYYVYIPQLLGSISYR